MTDGQKIPAALTKNWKKLFKSGVVIPVERNICNECNAIIVIINCKSQIEKKRLPS